MAESKLKAEREVREQASKQAGGSLISGADCSAPSNGFHRLQAHKLKFRLHSQLVQIQLVKFYVGMPRSIVPPTLRHLSINNASELTTSPLP